MDWVLVIVFVWLTWLPRYISAGVASVVLERACEVYQNPGTFLAYQGDKEYMKCSWDDTGSVVTSFNWTLNGNPFTPSSIHTTEANKQLILVEELDDLHAGEYRCTISTDSGVTSSAVLTLELQGLPVIVSSPTEAIHGQEITLTCKHSITNVTKITWFENGMSLYGLGRPWVIFNGTDAYSESIRVKLEMASTEASEVYTCRVSSQLNCYGANRRLLKDGVNKQSDRYEVDVKYPMKLSLSHERSEIPLNLNSDFDINCYQKEGDLPSTFGWFKHDKSGEKIPVAEVDTLQVIKSTDNGQTLRFYKAKPYMAGNFSCEGHNEYGTDVKTVAFTVIESPDSSGSYSNIVKLSGVPGVGTRFNIMCLDNYIDSFDKNKVEWFKDDKPLTLSRYRFEDNFLLILSLKRSDEGSYSCRYSDENHPIKFYSDAYQLDVVDMPPTPINLSVLVNETTENSLIIQWEYSEEGNTLATSVKVAADFSDNSNPDTKIENTLDCSPQCPTQYTLRGLAPGTRYDIKVTSLNNLQQETPSETIRHTTAISQKLTEKSRDAYVMKLTVGLVAGILVLVCAVGYFLFRRHKKDYKKKVYDKIEHELGYTIPSSKSLQKLSSKEIDFNSLRFTDTLGEGAFGKVMKAEAVGLKCPQGTQTCAVKMCREENDTDRRELLDEIKMLSRLGVHQHIIPLLGVCTKPGRPTCLITQHMPDGDLQGYLRNSRISFVGTYPFKPLTADSFQVNIHKMSNLNTSDDTLTSKDLISFARQIACGMEYVSSQKVVHRDLAARNVLVASKRSLKITDFGLARDMKGVNEEYVMGPNRKVPYRWLAPESFFEKRFTVHSDVWAYGVLLYEILTLGGSPYPRHTIRDIPEMLKKGYRMSPPSNSKPELNQLMTLCWAEAAESRPSFTEIKNLLDELLGDRPEEYLNCGDPEADILPNLNSNDNREMEEQNFRYSYLSTARSRDMISSITAQGYDRIADAHSAYNTITPATPDVGNHNSFDVSPLLSEIKSNPIPDTYQHLPVVEPSPHSDRKNSAQYINHDAGMSPVIVNADFTCGTENFVAQKL